MVLCYAVGFGGLLGVIIGLGLFVFDGLGCVEVCFLLLMGGFSGFVCLGLLGFAGVLFGFTWAILGCLLVGLELVCVLMFSDDYVGVV